MNKNKYFLIIIIVLFIFGCKEGYTTNNDIKGDYPIDINKIQYIYDNRTDRCFAYVKSLTAYGYEVISITNIKCNTDIKDKLDKIDE